MKLRLTKIDELQFLTCLKHGLWGSKTQRFKKWNKGDMLAIIVDKSMAGLAEVDGSPYPSSEIVWDNGLFPYRIPLKFIWVLDIDDRPPILGAIRDTLIGAWGTIYGWGIINQQPLDEQATETIVNEIRSRPNALEILQRELSRRIEEARLERESSKKGKRLKKAIPEQIAELREEEDQELEDVTEHTKIQHLVIKLGRSAGCLTWVATNDRGRTIGNQTLGDLCLDEMPSIGLNEEAVRRISLIDVLWIQQNAPVAAFEIETGTTISSGLLRMSDLLAAVPALKINLYLLAPKAKVGKVLKDLRGSTFAKIGLNEYCKFVAFEDIKDLIKRVEGLGGSITPSIIDRIAISATE